VSHCGIIRDETAKLRSHFRTRDALPLSVDLLDCHIDIEAFTKFMISH